MERVIVTNPVMGLVAMQVCAVKDVTDEEVLRVCNAKNPSGTTAGWSVVAKSNDDFYGEIAPIQCSDHDDRIHFIVLC